MHRGVAAQDGISTHICHVSPELSSTLIARARPASRGMRPPKWLRRRVPAPWLEERCCARSCSLSRPLAIFRQSFVCALMETSLPRM
jgi:hypothetical protein